MRCLLRLGLPAVLLGALVPARAQSAAPDFRPAPGKPPLLKAAAIREASGLAVSSRNNGFLWIVNDSGSAPDLHLVETGGTYRGKVNVLQALSRVQDVCNRFSGQAQVVGIRQNLDGGMRNPARQRRTLRDAVEKVAFGGVQRFQHNADAVAFRHTPQG